MRFLLFLLIIGLAALSITSTTVFAQDAPDDRSVLPKPTAIARSPDAAQAAGESTRVGGLRMTFRAAPTPGQQIDDKVIDRARTIMVLRLKEVGIRHALVQVSGADTIVVQLSPIDKPIRVIDLLQSTGQLEMIDPQGQYLPPGTVVSTTLDGASGSGIYRTLISSEDLQDIYLTTGYSGTDQVIGFALRDEAAVRLYDFTSTHVGEPMSLVIDKQVISSPSIRAAISTYGIIEGQPIDDLPYLVAELRYGPLPVPLQLVESRTIDHISAPAAASPVP